MRTRREGREIRYCRGEPPGARRTERDDVKTRVCYISHGAHKPPLKVIKSVQKVNEGKENIAELSRQEPAGQRDKVKTRVRNPSRYPHNPPSKVIKSAHKGQQSEGEKRNTAELSRQDHGGQTGKVNTTGPQYLTPCTQPSIKSYLQCTERQRKGQQTKYCRIE